ncbi:MAG: efflux RND transporter periplasmic adaptor subunit [Pseudomonadota bacterium]
MYIYARAAVIAAILAIAPGAIAAAPAVITVDARQIEALGIETVPLSGAGQGSRRSLPAQVVIPNAQIRVIAAPLSGLVQTMAVAPNDTVRQGQLLARLQSPMLIEAQREFLQAAAEARLAQDNLKRDEQLFKEGIIAEGRYQATRARHAQAAAALSQQRQSLRLYGMTDAAINALQSGRGMNSTLDIVAPIPGVVLEQMAAVGQRAEAATPLYRIAQVQPLWLEMRATPAAAAGIAPGAAVSVDGARGKVLSLGRHLDPATQTVMIRAEISQGAEKLRAGQYVEALVEAAAGEARQWQVPAPALVRHQGKTYVFVASKGGFVASEVRVLGEAASSATVTGALRGDERIAVKGIAALKAIWTGGGE